MFCIIKIRRRKISMYRTNMNQRETWAWGNRRILLFSQMQHDNLTCLTLAEYCLCTHTILRCTQQKMRDMMKRGHGFRKFSKFIVPSHNYIIYLYRKNKKIFSPMTRWCQTFNKSQEGYSLIRLIANNDLRLQRIGGSGRCRAAFRCFVWGNTTVWHNSYTCIVRSIWDHLPQTCYTCKSELKDETEISTEREREILPRDEGSW